MSRPLSSASILIADADQRSADLICQLIRAIHKDMDLTVCGDSATAIASIQQVRPALIIADHGLPGMGGVGLLQALRQPPFAEPIPFVLIKGRADVRSVREALPLQPAAYLTEPFDAERLMARIAPLLGQLCEDAERILPASEQRNLDGFLINRRSLSEGAPMPGSIHQLVQLLLDHECDLGTIERAFSSDPQITAVLIKAANSGDRHSARACQTLAQALPRLGVKHSINLAMGLSLRNGARLEDPALSVIAEEFWGVSQRTAEIARSLATTLQADADRCYTAGLLHCLGDLTVLRVLQDWRNEGGELDDAQIAESLRAHAAGFGGALRVRWRLPLELREIIGAAWVLGGGVYTREVLILHVAARYARMDGDDLEAILETKAARMLGLKADMLERVPAAA
ncbi:HDOD domain-containing protein [Pseudomonas sp. Marseille-QA0892]